MDLRGKKLMVIGGAGLIGCNLVRALNTRGYTNIVIADHLNHPDKQKNLDALEYAEFLDKSEFRTRFLSGGQRPVTTVFHLGACSATTETNADYLNDNNLLYTQQLCEWALANEARFIYASSAATYGEGEQGYNDDDTVTPQLKPLNLYGKSKQDFDLWAMDKGLLSQIVGLKYFNVYGPHEDHKGEMRSVVNKAYRQILDTGKLQLFRSHRDNYEDGKQERDFVYVKDAVATTLYFHDHPEVSGLFNCGTGTARTWLDLAHAIFAAMGREPDIEFIDMPISIRDKYQYHTLADVKKLHAAGCTAPFTPVEEAIRDYVQNYLEKQ
ncbi:MAG: ADP-glyceromanno-heptose 6-epimerase [Verrucomicrobia bacterium]|nr:ADP-glyceromanno-heptose 6-epimerase [Verrucomicrobiota bacterium]